MTLQQEAIETPLDAIEPVTRTRKPVSRLGLIWRRLSRMPRFWIGLGVFTFMVLWAVVGACQRHSRDNPHASLDDQAWVVCAAELNDELRPVVIV